MIKFWFDNYSQKRASHRLRAYIPCQELKKLGYNSEIINDIGMLENEDVVIFSKDSHIDNMRKVKSKGYKVGFDLCDNKFEEDDSLYRSYCNEVDFITANSITMQQQIKLETGRDSYVYLDPVEQNLIEPNIEFINNNPIKLVWYGGSSSNKYVDWLTVIPKLNSSKINYHLTIIVNSSEKLKNKLFKKSKKLKMNIDESKITYLEWAMDIQTEVVKKSDIVFMPVLASDGRALRRTITKSHNRVVDGIALGKWVVSSPLPSYVPLKDFCWLDDPIDGIKFYIKNQDIVKEKILKGQEWVKQNVTPECVAKSLLKIYKEIINE